MGVAKKPKLVKTTTYTRCPHCNSLFIVPFERRHVFGKQVICSADGCNNDFIAKHAETNGERGKTRSLMLRAEFEKEMMRGDYPFGILPEDFFRIAQSDAMPNSIAKAIRKAGINKASLSITEEGVIELIQYIAANPIVNLPSDGSGAE